MGKIENKIFYKCIDYLVMQLTILLLRIIVCYHFVVCSVPFFDRCATMALTFSFRLTLLSPGAGPWELIGREDHLNPLAVPI